MLGVANEELIDSMLKVDHKRADRMRRIEGDLEQKNKELKAALEREEMLKKDAESVTTLKSELRDSQGKLRCCMEQVSKVKARADKHASEVQELTVAVDLANSKNTRLTSENAELTQELEKAAQASQELLASEMEGARAHYQGVVDEVIEKYYLEGKVQGRKECLEDYNIAETDEVLSSDEDTQALSTLFPSLAQGPLATSSGDIAQTSEAALVQTTPAAENLAPATDPAPAEESPAPVVQEAAFIT